MRRLIPRRGEALRTIQDSFESCPDWPPWSISVRVQMKSWRAFFWNWESGIRGELVDQTCD